MWTVPVTDRTQEDIDRRTPKAYCNAADLNRLEANCRVLAELLGVDTIIRDWSRRDWPTVSQLARIRDNIQTLRGAYYTQRTTPPTPENPLNHWEKWNAAERILLDIYTLYLRNLDAAHYTGEAYAGDMIGVI